MALYHVMQLGVLLLLQFHTDIAFADDTIASTRIKRESSCEARFLTNYGSNHSACIAASPDVNESGVCTSDKQVILDLHNQHRRSVSPNATNMLQLSWDDSIAQTAQGWASTCPSVHDSSAQRRDYERYEAIGQNMAWGHSNWTSVVNGWASEVQYYNYDNNYSDVGGQAVGHYTQVVWANTFKIGCGYAKCGPKKTYVCNYGPSGNMYGEIPYVSGNTCADCSSSCNNGLCDCKGMECYNDGKHEFDRNKCTCTCKYGMIGDDCHVDCANVKKDASYCPYIPTICTYNNYKYSCAYKCGFCKA